MVLIRFAFLLLLALAGTVQAQPAFRAAASAGLASGGSGITHVAAGTRSERNDCGAVTPGLPAGRAVNDLLIALVVAREDTATFALPGGWEVLYGAVASGDFAIGVFYRFATNTAADNFTLTQSGTCSTLLARMSGFRGVNTTRPFEFTTGLTGTIPGTSVDTATTADFDAGTETPTINNAMALILGFGGDDRTLTQGAGWSESFDDARNLTVDSAISIHYQLQTTAAAFGGALNWDQSGGGSALRTGIALTLRPALQSLTINKPTGTVTDDVMIATVSVRPSTAFIEPPAGWTLVREMTQPADITLRMATYRKTATGSEGASYTFGLNGAHTGATGAIASFSSVDTTTPIDVEGGNTTAAAFTHTANAVTTVTANTMVVTAHSFFSATTWTPPAGMTEAADVASTTVPDITGTSLEMNYVVQAAAGTTGAKTATASATGTDAGDGLAFILALRPVPFTHYSVAPVTGTYATCEPAVIRVIAHNNSHVAVVPPAGTVTTINSSPTDGVWGALVTGAGVWNPNTAAGRATYTWNGTETFFEANLRRNTAGAVAFALSDPGGRTEGTGAEDTSVTFAASVLRITDATATSSVNVATQIAGKRNNEGNGVLFNQTLYVQAVQSASANVCTTMFQNQTKVIQFAVECKDPTTCSAVGGTTFQVYDNGGTPQTVNKHNNGAGLTYSSVNLNFDNTAAAKAPLSFRYNDAGQMRIYMRHVEATSPNLTISGTSNDFVVKPFGFAFRGANSGIAIQHGSTSSDTVLVPAGDPFTMTLVAHGWEVATEDANGDGLPDAGVGDTVDLTNNIVTPNFAATVTVNATINDAGATGGLSRGTACTATSGTITSGEWVNGVATVTDWCYNEVGNPQFAASSVSYKGDASANIVGFTQHDGTGYGTGRVGRFIPKRFVLSAGAITNRSASSCAPASTFTYMDEGLQLGFTLTAQNTAGNTTTNYRTSTGYSRLGLGAYTNGATEKFRLGASSGATDLSARMDMSGTPSGTWTLGVATVAAPTLFARATPDNPDGPYATTNIGIRLVDLDSVTPVNDLTIGGVAHKNLGATGHFRYGRLRVLNALGSEKLALPIPITTQYWAGTGFVTNTLDSCTTVARDKIALGNYNGSIAPGGGNCKTNISQSPDITFANGVGTMTLTAPNVSGSLTITPQIGSTAAGSYCDNSSSGEDAISGAAPRLYLRGRWNDASNPDSNANTNYDDNPVGQAAFGIYGSQPSNFIYFRENH